MLKLIFSYSKNKANKISHSLNLKFFARKEINKISLIQNFHQVQNTKSSSDSHQIEKIEENLQNQKIPILSIEETNEFLNINFLNLKISKEQPFKFLETIKNKFFFEKLLNNEKFINSLKEISINYSKSGETFQQSTVFKFIVLIDQILTKKSLSEYQKNNITHSAFPHLISHFGPNFNSIFESNPEMLLKYNFLYFMSINKGEFSECLRALLEHFKIESEEYKSIQNLLSTKFIINNEQICTSIKSKFLQIDDNINTPSSDFIKDYAFRYLDKKTKIKELNENIEEKRTYEKIKLIYHNLIRMKHSKQNLNLNELNNIQSSIRKLSAEKSKSIFEEKEYTDVKAEVDKLNKYIQFQITPLTKIKINNKFIENINFSNLHEVFNPLFSGEFDLANQFKIVAEVFDNLFAIDLLSKYIESISLAETFSFYDLYQLNLILSLKNVDAFSDILFITHDHNLVNKIEYNLQRRQVEISDYIPKSQMKQDVKSERKPNPEIPIVKSKIEPVKRNLEIKKEQPQPEVSKPRVVTKAPEPVREVEKQIERKLEKIPTKNEKIIPVKEDKILADSSKGGKIEAKPFKEVLRKAKNTEQLKPRFEPIKRDLKPVEEMKTKHIEPIKTEARLVEEIKTKHIEPIKMVEEIETKHIEPIKIETKQVEEIKTKHIEPIKMETTPVEEIETRHIEPIKMETTPIEEIKTSAETVKEIKTELKTEQIKKAEIIVEDIKTEEVIGEPIRIEEIIVEAIRIEEIKVEPVNVADLKSKAQQVIPEPNLNKNQQESNSLENETLIEKDTEKLRKQFKSPSHIVGKTSAGFYKSNKSRFATNVNKESDKEPITPVKKPLGSVLESKTDDKLKKEAVLLQQNEKKKKHNFSLLDKNETPKNIETKSVKIQLFEPIQAKKTSSIIQPIKQKVSENENILKNLENLSERIRAEEDETLYYSYRKDNRDNINLKLADSQYDVEYWEKKLVSNDFMEGADAEGLEKHVYTQLTKTFTKHMKDKGKFLCLLYSLTNPQLDYLIIDLGYCFYQIFSNSPMNAFNLNLGHIGYQILLNNNLLDSSIKNRENLEKIVQHMEANLYVPNNENINAIIAICNKNYYPKYLKQIIDNYVLNKGVMLSQENYLIYLQIITNFEEYKEYYENLINNSYIDFQIPIKAEFFEYLIYNALVNSNTKHVENCIKILNQRFITDYPDEEERVEFTIEGYKFLINNFNQFAENSLNNNHDISYVKSKVVELTMNMLDKIKSFNAEWKNDLILVKLLTKFYYVYSVDLINYFNNVSDIIANASHSETKNYFTELINILKHHRKSLNTNEQEKAILLFRKFTDSHIVTGDLTLSYEEKFDLFRKENISNVFAVFRKNKTVGKEKESVKTEEIFLKFLNSVLDPVTFMKLHKSDVIAIEFLMNKICENKSNVQLFFNKFENLNVGYKINKLQKNQEEYLI